MILSPPIPLRYRLHQELRCVILEGRIRPGDRLPSEKELMAQHKVSRHTVREAVRDLVLEGIVRIERGRGTFVAPPRIEQELTSLTGFVEDMLSLGLRPAARVLSVTEVGASGAVASRLNLAEGEPVIRIERIRLADSEPISFDLTFLPAHVGRKVAVENLDLYRSSACSRISWGSIWRRRSTGLRRGRPTAERHARSGCGREARSWSSSGRCSNNTSAPSIMNCCITAVTACATWSGSIANVRTFAYGSLGTNWNS